MNGTLGDMPDPVPLDVISAFAAQDSMISTTGDNFW
jgi:hypothetical protein